MSQASSGCGPTGVAEEEWTVAGAALQDLPRQEGRPGGPGPAAAEDPGPPDVCWTEWVDHRLLFQYQISFCWASSQAVTLGITIPDVSPFHY